MIPVVSSVVQPIDQADLQNNKNCELMKIFSFKICFMVLYANFTEFLTFDGPCNFEVRKLEFHCKEPQV